VRTSRKFWKLRRRWIRAFDPGERARAKAWAERVDSDVLAAMVTAGVSGHYTNAARAELDRREGR
jgi:hypothetical protein